VALLRSRLQRSATDDCTVDEVSLIISTKVNVAF